MREIGSIIDDKYRVLDVLNESDMSTVYQVRNISTNINWAIKEVPRVGEKNMEVQINSLIAEIDMLKKLKNDYLPQIIDVINEGDSILIVMELIEGKDLEDKLDKEGALPQENVIRWAKQLCEVLNYLHHREPAIIYRDMKPSNIMLKPNNNIAVIDFGTAREVVQKNVSNTKSLGTEGYAAPEQYGENAYADERTDIYNFGATIFHLITGEYPDPFRIFEHPIREYNPSLSLGIEEIIIKCTQLDPNNRYQNCDELQYDLENYDIIDTQTISKNKSKIAKFISSVVITALCFIVAFFGLFQNANQIQAKYEDYIKSEKYVDALKLVDTNREAYDGIINTIIKDDGIIDDDDIKILNMFESYENDEKNSNGEEITPLNDLASSKISDYVYVCYTTGQNLWDKYKTPYSSTDIAARWFKRILPDNYLDINLKDFKEGDTYQISVSGNAYNIKIGNDSDITLRQFQVALVGAQISNCKDNLKTTSTGSGSNFNSFSNEDEKIKAYRNLWDKLIVLKDLSESLSDEQLIIMLFNEVCVELKDNNRLEGIATYNNINSANEFNELIFDSLEKTLSNMNDNSNAEKMLEKINSVKEFIKEYYGG